MTPQQGTSRLGRPVQKVQVRYARAARPRQGL
jgi:hypothetical protein